MDQLVRQMAEGDIFRVSYGPHGHEDFRLIYVNECRAWVEPVTDGRRGEKTNIAPGTVCTRVKVNDQELEEFLGMSTGMERDPFDDDPVEIEDDFLSGVTTTKTATRSNAPAAAAEKPKGGKGTRGPRGPRGDGKRNKEPGVQTKAIKEGTIRHKLFNHMKQTKSIAKLMERTGMDKPLLLSHINEFWRAHGYGYTVDGDRVELIPPKKVNLPK